MNQKSLPYITEGENGFVGMQSRSNPLELQAGMVQYSQNMRMDKGIGVPRKGNKRLTTEEISGTSIYGSCAFSTVDGVDKIILLAGNGLYVYNTSDGTTSAKYSYPSTTISSVVYYRTITATDSVCGIQANDKLYILRGQGSDGFTPTSITHPSPNGPVATVTKTAHGLVTGDEVIITGVTNNTNYNGSYIITKLTNDTFTYTTSSTLTTDAISTGTILIRKAKAPLVWDGSSVAVTPQGSTSSITYNSIASTYYNIPTSDFGIYFKNRLVCKTDRDRIACSNYFSFDVWDLDFAQFRINLGANDYITGFCPWQEDKFIIFQRNSIYYAFTGTEYTSGYPPAGDAFVKSLTSEFGCSARRSIVNAGEYIFFLSDNGVYLLNPTLDLKLLGNTTPLSDPISDIMARINVNYVKNAIGKFFNNRYYLAVPLDGSTRNNAVLVYSMLNKAWESVDTFPTGFYVDEMVVGLYGNAKNVYYINTEYGIFSSETITGDELGISTGLRLPFVLPSVLALTFVNYPVDGQILTRRYFGNTFSPKRFSGAQVDLKMAAGDSMQINAVVTNPDSTTNVYSFSSLTDNDYTKRFKLVKRGFGLDMQFKSITGRPNFRGLRLTAIDCGANARSDE